MANKNRPAKRRAYNGQAGAQREDRDLAKIERDLGRAAVAVEVVLAGGTADLDEPLVAARKILEEAPDRVRLEERILARFAARMELEDWAARAFLSGVLSAVVRALQAIAGDPRDLRDRGQVWLHSQDQARALGEQLFAFCAAREINAREWPKGSSFIDLLSDRDKAAMIENLRDSGVSVGSLKLELMQRDACAVIGVNEDYPANVRRRHKHPVKKTG